MRMLFFFLCYRDHRDLHVLTHACPTRRSSDLLPESNEITQPFPDIDTPDPATSDVLSTMFNGKQASAHEKTWFSHVAMSDSFWKALISRSEEHTSELQSIMRNAYAVFCLKKKEKTNQYRDHRYQQQIPN